MSKNREEQRLEYLNMYMKMSLKELIMVAVNDESREPSTFRQAILSKMSAAGIK